MGEGKYKRSGQIHIMLIEATLFVTIAGLVISSLYDLKTGEIPDPVTVGMITLIILISIVATASGDYFEPLIWTILWGVLFFVLGYVLFELGQWGGGDVKLMGCIGASFGLLTALGYQFITLPLFEDRIPILAVYFINMAFLSTPYVVIYTLALGLTNPHAFVAFASKIKKPRHGLMIAASTLPLALTIYLQQYRISFAYTFVPLFYIASVYMKTVEDKVLSKEIPVKQLADWDILVKDLVVDGKRIAKMRNIEGVTPEQVKTIKELAKAGTIPDVITIRWGIKFGPIIFLAYPVTIWCGNLLEKVFIWMGGV